MTDDHPFAYERSVLSASGPGFVVGMDEAGRGPLAGPVVAAAACFRDRDFRISDAVGDELRWIRDSKTLSLIRREKVFSLLPEHFWLGIGVVSPETIDRINILEATFLAMKQAFADLRRKMAEEKVVARPGDWQVLVDGNLPIPRFSVSQEPVVGGDRTVKSIAAASIAAKVTRDRMLLEYDREWPSYGFARHKGYGTREHMQALERYGPLPVHRRSFAPVRQAVIRFRELGIGE